MKDAAGNVDDEIEQECAKGKVEPICASAAEGLASDAESSGPSDAAMMQAGLATEPERTVVDDGRPRSTGA